MFCSVWVWTCFSCEYLFFPASFPASGFKKAIYCPNLCGVLAGAGFFVLSAESAVSFICAAGEGVLYVPYPAVQILLSVWLTGFVCIFGFQVFSHLRFSKSLKRNSCPEEDPRLLGLWKYWKKKLEIGDLTRPIQLRRCRGIRTPLTVGLYRGSWITYLPERDFTEEEAELIFSHELHHIQRRTRTRNFSAVLLCAGMAPSAGMARGEKGRG